MTTSSKLIDTIYHEQINPTQIFSSMSIHPFNLINFLTNWSFYSALNAIPMLLLNNIEFWMSQWAYTPFPDEISIDGWALFLFFKIKAHIPWIFISLFFFISFTCCVFVVLLLYFKIYRKYDFFSLALNSVQCKLKARFVKWKSKQ